jgi:D-psicose/D-tagatose/L-ribulose 3-epimerase
MKIGMNVLLWTGNVDESHYPLLQKIKTWGYDGVELTIFGGSDKQWEGVGRKVTELGLGATAVTIVGPDTNPISDDAKVRAAAVDAFKQKIEWARLANVEVFCGPFYSPVGCLDRRGKRVTDGRNADEWKWAVEFFSKVAPFAQQADITLAVEPLNRFETYFLNTSADGAGLVREVNHPNFKMMVDTFHTNIEEKDVYAAFADNGDTMAHIHISENDRSTPGEGHVLWDEVFSALDSAGYDGWLVVEAFGQALPELAGATCIWRKMFPDEETLCKNALAFIKQRLAGE